MAMTYDDYKAQVLADAKESIEENAEYCEDWNEMFDALFLSDGVTGNGSGSYFFNSVKAMDAVSSIIWDTDFTEAYEGNFGERLKLDNPESVDVRIRCYMLYAVYGELEDYYNEVKAKE